MAQISVPCSKDCGADVPVDEQTINNAAVLGVKLNVAHDVCPAKVEQVPNEPETVKQRRFRLQIILWEVPGRDDPIYLSDDNPDGIPIDTPVTWKYPSLDGHAVVEELAGIGTFVDGHGFATAVNGPMTEWLTKTWPTLQESAHLADMTPAPASEE